MPQPRVTWNWKKWQEWILMPPKPPPLRLCETEKGRIVSRRRHTLWVVWRTTLRRGNLTRVCMSLSQQLLTGPFWLARAALKFVLKNATNRLNHSYPEALSCMAVIALVWYIYIYIYGYVLVWHIMVSVLVMVSAGLTHHGQCTGHG